MNTTARETELAIKERAANDIRSALQGKLGQSEIDAMIDNVSTRRISHAKDGAGADGPGAEDAAYGSVSFFFYTHVWVATRRGYKFEGDAFGFGQIAVIPGGASGDIYTDDLGRLFSDTRSFMVTTAVAYSAIYFYDENHKLLGHLQGIAIGNISVYGGKGCWHFG